MYEAMYAAARQVLEALDKVAGGGGLVSPVEVVGAEILIERAVLEHVTDGAQEGGGDGADGFLGASAGLDSVELAWKWLPLVRAAAHASVRRQRPEGGD